MSSDNDDLADLNAFIESLKVKALDPDYPNLFGEDTVAEYDVEIEKSITEAINRTFGENQGIAYGKGRYFSPDKNPMGDTWYKDVAMTVLQPISLAINSALVIAGGAIGMALSILFTPFSEDARMIFALSAATTAMGIGEGLLAAIAPIARTYNLATRVYATVTDDLTEEQVDTLKVDTVQQIKDAFPTPANASATEKYKSALDTISEGDASDKEDTGPDDSIKPHSNG